MKIAAQLYTLRDYLRTPDEIGETLRRLKEIGYRAVEVASLGAIGDQQFKELADQNGLDICASHSDLAELMERPETAIARHRLWNCSIVGVGGMPTQYRNDADGYKEFARIASDVGRNLKSAGLTFVYHNHDFEYVKFGGSTGMDILLRETDPEAVNFELDLHWVQSGGADPVEWIGKLGSRLKSVHLKDMVVTGHREPRFAEVGEGNMNYRHILNVCREAGVEWGIVEQDDCYGRDPFECVARSIANVSRLGGLL